MNEPRTIRVAVAQAAPVLFDRAAGTDKACQIIREAAANGARLVLLPEAFIPCYPRGLMFGTKVGGRTSAGRDLFRWYWEESVVVPGPTTSALADAAREANAHVAIGVVERDLGTLYCTLLVFGPDGSLLHKHRKLKPTAAERFLWGEGDGTTLRVLDTAVGRVGGLICWENYMPLARMALYQQGVEIYLAPTADARESWVATMRHIACEGRCFVLGANQFVTRSMYPPSLADEVKDQLEIVCRGGSVIISPLGDVLAGPVWDREETLYADLDLDDVVRGKMDLDVAGHYSRPDVFQLTVKPARTDVP
jgi:nitrilase